MILVAFAAYLSAAPVCKPWVPEDGNWGYGRRVAISLNQLFNALIGGQPDETLSSRAGRNRKKNRVAKVTCWALDKLDPCHCDGSIELDKDGRPQPHQFYIAPPRNKDK